MDPRRWAMNALFLVAAVAALVIFAALIWFVSGPR